MIISNEFCVMHINFIYIIDIFIIYNRLFYIVNSSYFNLSKCSMIYARKCTYREQILKQKKIDLHFTSSFFFFLPFFTLNASSLWSSMSIAIGRYNRFVSTAMPISYLRIIITLNSWIQGILIWNLTGLVGKIKYENLIKHRQMIHLKRRNLENKTLINAIVLVKI